MNYEDTKVIERLMLDLRILQEEKDAEYGDGLVPTAANAAEAIGHLFRTLNLERFAHKTMLSKLAQMETENEVLREDYHSLIEDVRGMEPLIDRLERENAALRKDVYQCPPTSENDYEGLKWCDAFDVAEGDNAKLHNEVTALKHENAALRQDKERLDWLEEGHAWPEYIDAEWHSKGQVFLSFRDAIDAARAKEGQP